MPDTAVPSALPERSKTLRLSTEVELITELVHVKACKVLHGPEAP